MFIVKINALIEYTKAEIDTALQVKKGDKTFKEQAVNMHFQLDPTKFSLQEVFLYEVPKKKDVEGSASNSKKQESISDDDINPFKLKKIALIETSSFSIDSKNKDCYTKEILLENDEENDKKPVYIYPCTKIRSSLMYQLFR